MKYISMLRGINVSGQKKIKMADLATLYESLGFDNVVTYIQSGNVIFDVASKKKTDLILAIEKAIERQYSFQVPVVLRTGREFKIIIDNCPFGVIDDATKVLVTFLSATPTQSNLERLQASVTAPERCVIQGTEVFLSCPNGYGGSKLSNAFLEKRLGVNATTRNWKSVCRLYQLSME